jgi:hypothetical protein
MRRFVVASTAVLVLDAAWMYLPLLFPSLDAIGGILTPCMLSAFAVAAVGWMLDRSLRDGLLISLGAIAGTVAAFSILLTLAVTDDGSSGGEYFDPECRIPEQELLSEIVSRPAGEAELVPIFGSARLVRSPDVSGVRYIAIQFRVDGKTGVWATAGRSGKRVIMAVDDNAKRLTTWPAADKTDARITSDVATIQRAKACTV